MNLFYRLWTKVHQPRAISVTYFFIYGCVALGGLSALIAPPRSIEGAVGSAAMTSLAILLTFGGLVGVIAVLPGIWWLERTAVLSVALGAFIYSFIILGINIGETGNRLLQLSFVIAVLLMQGVRWHRIRLRPYDPSRGIPPTDEGGPWTPHS